MHLLYTFENWSRNQQALENNILDFILKKKNELETINNGSPVRKEMKKPSRLVVPQERLLSTYAANPFPSEGIIQTQPIMSLPDLEFHGIHTETILNASSPSLMHISNIPNNFNVNIVEKEKGKKIIFSTFILIILY